MPKASDTITKQVVDLGGDPDEVDNQSHRRIMNANEIAVRGELNIQNTASSLRAKVIAELALQNGHSIPSNGKARGYEPS